MRVFTSADGRSDPVEAEASQIKDSMSALDVYAKAQEGCSGSLDSAVLLRKKTKQQHGGRQKKLYPLTVACGKTVYVKDGDKRCYLTAIRFVRDHDDDDDDAHSTSATLITARGDIVVKTLGAGADEALLGVLNLAVTNEKKKWGSTRGTRRMQPNRVNRFFPI